MRAPNSELFRLVRFAIRFRGWHPFQTDARPHIQRAANLGLLEVDWDTRQFRLPEPESTQGAQAPTYIQKVAGSEE